MILQTPVEISSFSAKITHHHRILLMGSCFAENIGNKLAETKFTTDCNPFGTVYNPVSLLHCFEMLEKPKLFTKDDIFYENGIWNSFYHHSRFSNTDANTTLKNINDRIISSSEFLHKADFLFITLGTSWVYEHIEKKIVVSNCHKVPASQFKHRLLTMDETVNSLQQIIEIAKNCKRNISIIFSVSPVQHLKDGAHANSVSKSVLLVALYKIQEINKDIFYFPAYEILLDELRNYRFYADDMIHPSSKSVEYIWEKFNNTFFDALTIGIIKEIEKLRHSMLHKPFFCETEDFKKFMQHNYAIACELNNKYPYIEFKAEKDFFAM